MESTSVYWIPLHQILEDRGFSVYPVKAHYAKNVPGRKSDASDCQWIQYLHSVGLLRASFRSPSEICAIRSLWRHRESLVQMAAQHILHMQKSLDQMNLHLHHVLSNITGLSGLAILDAILAGERDPVELAKLCHWRVRELRVFDPGRKTHRGLLWTLIGAGAGAGASLAACIDCQGEGRAMTKYVPLGVAVGAAIGALGFLSSPYRTEYKSR
jgi:transposase